MKLQLKRSNVIESGAAKEPTAAQLEYGELAINYNTTDPAIFLKDSNNNVIRISGVGNIADDGQVELPASTTPPLNPEDGNLWYNSDDGRLYIYYNDGDSAQWVDASPDSWDPSSYPDVSDNTAQSGTLDDRYLMLNSANDPITGGLNITSGNVGIGTNSPSALLDLSSNNGLSSTLDSETIILNVGVPVNPSGSTITNLKSGSRRIVEGGTTSSQSESFIHASRGGISFDPGSAGSERAVELSYSTDSFVTQEKALTVKTDGTVGIGTNDPQRKLHVEDLTGSVELLLETTSSYGSTISFGDEGNLRAGKIEYDHPSNSFRLNLAGSEKIRIASSGSVGIGTDNPGASLEIATSSVGAGVPTLFLNRSATASTTTDIALRANAVIRSETSIRSVVNTDGYFSWNIGGTDVKSGTTGASEIMRIDTSGSVGIGTTTPNTKLEVNGNIGIGRVAGAYTFRGTGDGAERAGIHSNSDNDLIFKTGQAIEQVRVQSQGGISFNGDTATANALDDYEEGTWTATITQDGTVPLYSATPSSIVSRYTKIGNQVHARIAINFSSNTALNDGGKISINLPFAELNNYQSGVGVALNGTSQNYTLPFNILTSNLRATAFDTPASSSSVQRISFNFTYATTD